MLHPDSLARLSALLFLAAALGPFAQPCLAEAEAGNTRIEDLERRIEELEADDAGDAGDGFEIARWAERIRLGGSANTGYYGGQKHAFDPDEEFRVWDARLWVDADLGREARVFDTTVVRNVGFTFEWDAVRIGEYKNMVGELYVDFQALGDSAWANLQVGRFQTPIGEAYLRYSQGHHTKPFISNPVGAPWYWDEGLKFYGTSPNGALTYIASVTEGETSFNGALSGDKQYTLKLATDPTDWLHLSASGLYTGKIGSNADEGSGAALWLGESWAKGFGALPVVENYIDGDPAPNGPNRIEESWYIGGDAIAEKPGQARLWLSYGYYDVDRKGGRYDRQLHAWTAELLLFGGLVTPDLAPFYVGLRASGLGTYEDGEGDLLDHRTFGTIGYNAKSIEDYSVVLGWNMLKYVTLRAEYTHREIDVVDGVDDAVDDAADHNDSWGVEVGIHF